MIPCVRLLVVPTMVLAVLPTIALADDTIDLDLWHQELAKTLGEEPAQAADRQPTFGIYPTVGGSLGPPNWVSAQGHVYLSLTDGKHFSIFAGYGEERGPRADASIITVGWGGVRAIPVVSKQNGFHGKFLRYRRWDDEDHGVHHGLSFGTESGVGFAALAFEVGAARSQQNHWLITVQMALKFAAPIRIPLAKKHKPPPEPDS